MCGRVLKACVTVAVRNGAVVTTLRDHVKRSTLRVSTGQRPAQTPADSSESGSAGRMFASPNGALCTMVPCKWRKRVVRYHLERNRENSSSGDEVFVEKETTFRGKIPLVEVSRAVQPQRVLWGGRRGARGY